MNSDSALFLLSHMLIQAAIISSPILLVCLLVGLLVSLFQVATQIQEMTLTFVPKLIAVGITLLLLGRWILLSLVDFLVNNIEKIAHF
ncbi:flagellar biosynthetic protein FliQ [Vibrio sp. MEBiC08052]|uniref:flagellar biosynthetic protein FliQ n=1 Tax=Vibrio sp. MEBiC08052 TaxID=1761910 RepID=UPI0007407C81|nr:hypothetical protein VRK_38870 [Vibrio sp. MEBiC08052]